MADEIEYEGLPANAGLGVSPHVTKTEFYHQLNALMKTGEHAGRSLGEYESQNTAILAVLCGCMNKD